MFKSIPKVVGCAVALAISAGPVLADFTYQENSQITGGSMLGALRFAGTFAKKGQKPTDPTVSTISIKGNRMVRRSLDIATIMDLDQETITSIHYAKKTYSVITFAQMKQQLAQLSDKAQSNDGAQKGNATIEVKVNDTGQSREISGNQTHEVMVNMTVSSTDPNTGNTGSMNMVSDMWIAPDVAGYEEAKNFNKRIAEALGWAPGSNPMLNRPDLGKAMAEMYKEGSKLNGVPLETTLKMSVVGQPGPTSQPQSTDAANQTPSAPAPTSMGGALGNALGSHFGMGRHKKQDDSNADGTVTNSGSLVEMTTRVTSFNTADVDPTAFDIPAGFSRVDEPGMSRARK